MSQFFVLSLFADSKLMRLDRGRPDIRFLFEFKSILIEFLDWIPAVRLLVATNPIRDLGPNSNLTSKSRSEFESNFEFISKMVQFEPNCQFWSSFLI